MSDQSPNDSPPQIIRQLVGHIWVDSGQLILTDPIYLEELDADTIEPATSLKQRYGLVNDGMAAAFRSGLRNAKYPVYVTRFENGALARIEVVLDDRGETSSSE
jgi:hypothetical protein